jgi:FtsZ-interacting cell division protein ZipA
MPTWGWILVAIGAAIVIAAIAWSANRKRRRAGLQDTFGAEYDRTVADAPSRREAEAELAERRRRREELEITPLEQSSRDRYMARWRQTQEKFVDDPQAAVFDADALIQEVMRERGYPVEDFDQRASDLSVDHADVISNYRAAHAIAVADQRGNATTDDLRDAVVHYRALFSDLVEVEPAKLQKT